MAYEERPMRPSKGGAYGTVSSASAPDNITIPQDARGAEVYVSADARILVTNSTADVTVNDTNFGYIPGGTSRLLTFWSAAQPDGDRQIQIASRDGSAVIYHVAFLA